MQSWRPLFSRCLAGQKQQHRQRSGLKQLEGSDRRHVGRAWEDGAALL
jgi:hypothetical protein